MLNKRQVSEYVSLGAIGPGQIHRAGVKGIGERQELQGSRSTMPGLQEDVAQAARTGGKAERDPGC